MNNTQKHLYGLIETYFYNCENFGCSDFVIWCEDNLENDEQKALFNKIKNEVNYIADKLFL